MNPRQLTVAALLLGMLVLAIRLVPVEHPAPVIPTSPPNILLILADDLGVNDIGALGDGVAPTPNLDALARAGVRFRRHYANATCRPSRQALLTGRESSRIGVPPYVRGISPEVITLPEALSNAGYQTSHIGKWHLGDKAPQALPDQQGFQRWRGFLRAELLGHGTLDRSLRTYVNPWLQGTDSPPTRQNGHLTDILTAAAISEIQRLSAGSKPWFLNLWYFAPHSPIEPHQRFARRFPDTGEGRYLALLAQLDAAVGRLLNTLESNGALANTLVVFASDNGGTNRFRDSNAPLYGRKNTFWEGGVRTPLIFSQPGRLEPRDIDNAVFIRELMPTLLDYAGVPSPAGVTGRNLRPLLQGRELPPPATQFWDFQAWTLHKFGMLDVASGELIYDNTRQRWMPDDERFGAPGDLEEPARHDVQAAYRDWAAATRRVPLVSADSGERRLWQGDSFRRTPGYGGWTLQVPMLPGHNWSATQSGQFSLSVAGEALEVALPGHRFTARVAGDGCRLLSLSTYYLWRNREQRQADLHVALYLDEQLIHETSLAVTDEVFSDSLQPLALEGNLSRVAIHNDYLDADLLNRYQATGSGNEPETSTPVCTHP